MRALCDAEAVVPGVATLVRLSQTASIILLRDAAGAVMGWRNACPHMGIELDWQPERLLTRNGRFLRCTGHDALFDAHSGVCTRGPCVGEALTRAPVRVMGGQVVLDEQAVEEIRS